MNELWSRGDRVTCGVISEDTRVSCICQSEPPANSQSTGDIELTVTLNDNLASADCYSGVMSFNPCPATCFHRDSSCTLDMDL